MRAAVILVTLAIAGCGGSGSVNPALTRDRATAQRDVRAITALCHAASPSVDQLQRGLAAVDRLHTLMLRYPHDDRVQRLVGAAVVISDGDCPALS